MTSVTTTEAPSLADLAEQANVLHRVCVDAQRSAAEAARDCGRLLLDAKDRLPHGEWTDWLAANCSFSARTARRYMRIADHWDELQRRAGAKGTRASVLTIRAAVSMLVEPDDSPLVIGEAGARYCPTCGTELQRTSRRWETCVACWGCRLHPADWDQPATPGGSVEAAEIRQLHALAARLGYSLVEVDGDA